MKKRILDYARKTDLILEENSKDTDWEAQIGDLLVWIGFFQHERLVHLLVTLTFALLTLGGIIMTVLTGEFMAALLTFLFLVLLVPYIFHYYLLENEVQKLYDKYGRMKELANKSE